MRTRLVTVVAVAAFATLAVAALGGIAACSKPVQQEAPQIREAITAINDEYIGCYANLEADCVASFFSEEGVMAMSNTPTLAGTDAIRRFWQQAFGWGQWELSLTTQLIEPSEPLAIERGRYVLKFTAGPGAPPNRTTTEDRGTFLVHWRHDPDGKWRIAVQAFVTENPGRVITAPMASGAPVLR